MVEQRQRVKGREWWVTCKKPRGGFVLVRQDAIFAAWAALCRAEIELRDFRIWLASFEVLERRIGLRADRTPKFTELEFRRLVGGVGRQHFRTSVRRLERAGLGRWSESAIELHGSRSCTAPVGGRLVPIPRPLLRHLARSRGRAYIATGLAHVLRCLFYRRGLCISGGYCKASWVAETFDVAERAVKAARKSLSGAGLLLSHHVHQLRLNRFGSAIVINPNWSLTSKSALPKVTVTTESAPLKKQESFSLRRRLIHQKPGPTPVATGVHKTIPKPTLRHLREDDLLQTPRLMRLLVQAEARGLVKRCDADRLLFVSAAEHAMRVGTRNACGLFASMIHSGRYSTISQDDEDAARRRLASLRDSGEVDLLA